MLNVNAGLPPNDPALLNCTCVSDPPGVPEPPEPVTQFPLILKQPPDKSMPPANVEVPVFVSDINPVSVPPASARYDNDGISLAVSPASPCTVELVIVTPLSESIFCESAISLVKPPVLGELPRLYNSDRSAFIFSSTVASEMPPAFVEPPYVLLLVVLYVLW